MKRLKDDIRQYAFPVLAVLAIWSLANLFFEHFCPVVLLTGFPCPGCGLTRAFFSLSTFDIGSVFQYNPMIFLWIALAVYFAYKRYVRGGSMKGVVAGLIVVCICTIAFYVWRMMYRFPGLPPMVYEPKNLFAIIFKH